MIEFYKYIKNGGEPLSVVSKEEYNDMKDNPEKYSKFLLGNVKYMASFGGKPWGGYGGVDKRNGHNHYESSLTNFKKQIPRLKEIIYTSSDYEDLDYINKSIIVCDPPYKNTTGYKGIKFDYERFYKWFRKMSKINYCILCEYVAPEDFTPFLSLSVAKTLAANDNKTIIKDSLFYCDGLFKDWYEN